MSQKCKLLKRAVQVKEQVSEAGVRRLQIRWSCKFHRKTSVLESISNKAAGLKVCNSIKKRLQHSCLPVKLAKFLKTPFFTEEFQWLFLTFNSCFQRSSEQTPVLLSAANTRVSWIKYLLPRKFRSSHRRCSVKEGLERPAQVFSCEYCNMQSFLRTPILKNICERLLLQQQIYRREVIFEFYYLFKAISILNFAMADCFFL